MGAKHATITAPTGVSLTGTLIHQKRTQDSDRGFEMKGSGGALYGGKSLAKRTQITVSGEGLDTLALPSPGTGSGTSTSPFVENTEVTENSEGNGEFSLTCMYESAGQGDWAVGP